MLDDGGSCDGLSANVWIEAGFELDPESSKPMLTSARNKMDEEFSTLSSEFTGFLGVGAIDEIEKLCPEDNYANSSALDDDDGLLPFTFGELLHHMSQAFHISADSALQAVEDGVLAFATFQKKEQIDRDKNNLKKSGLVAENTLVPGTKTKKIWVVYKAEQSDSVDTSAAAKLCATAVKATTCGPFQQHMQRYRLELAQCNGHIGRALLRTFIDSFLFDLVRTPMRRILPPTCS